MLGSGGGLGGEDVLGASFGERPGDARLGGELGLEGGTEGGVLVARVGWRGFGSVEGVGAFNGVGTGDEPGAAFLSGETLEEGALGALDFTEEVEATGCARGLQGVLGGNGAFEGGLFLHRAVHVAGTG